MNQWNQGRLVDIFSHIDASVLEDDGIECDIRDTGIIAEGRKRWNKKKITLMTGITVGSMALTGAAVAVCRKGITAKKTVKAV